MTQASTSLTRTAAQITTQTAIKTPVETTPGRSCPLHYRYRTECFATPAPPELDRLDVLYVVGGLYGNEQALERVLALFDAERGRKRLVFNGDFHWFDADPSVFERIQRSVLEHTALRGNVETELAAATPGTEDEDVGCGCAYPEWVGDEVVARSNRILRKLKQAVTPAQRMALAALPMWLRADVGDFKLGIVHGDAQSLAGWGFAQEHLRHAAHRAQVHHWFELAEVDAFACTHTCLPVFQRLHRASTLSDSESSGRWIFNNGAAGMPNFVGDGAGLLTRVASTPWRGDGRRFGIRDGDIWVDAIAVEVDRAAWHEAFLCQWPEGSDAHESYFTRMVQGPAYSLHEALRVAE
jgi:hypothetical protein